MEKVEQIDLRNKFVNKGTGERPYTIFNDNITGVITGFSKVQTTKGINFSLEIKDSDGDNSTLQCKFYGKYTENLLGRLVLTKPNDNIYFFPYAIPSTSKDDAGRDFKFYNQGVSIQLKGQKLNQKYNKDNNYTVDGLSMPPTERIQDQEGKMATSRVKRINFLFDEFSKIYANLESAPQPIGEDIPAHSEEDDLPF